MAVDQSEVKPEGTVVAAVGSTSPLGRGVRGSVIEAAMANASLAAEAEAKAIWEKEGLSVEEKNAQISKIMSPEAILARKLKAREQAKADYRDLEAKALQQAAEKQAAQDAVAAAAPAQDQKAPKK